MVVANLPARARWRCESRMWPSRNQAGGIIWVAAAYLRDSDDVQTLKRIEQIGVTLTEIFEESASKDMPTGSIADLRARDMLM